MEDAKCELVGDVMAVKVISRLLASLPESPGAWPPLPLEVSEGKIVAKEDEADYARVPNDEPQSPQRPPRCWGGQAQIAASELRHRHAIDAMDHALAVGRQNERPHAPSCVRGWH